MKHLKKLRNSSKKLKVLAKFKKITTKIDPNKGSNRYISGVYWRICLKFAVKVDYKTLFKRSFMQNCNLLVKNAEKNRKTRFSYYSPVELGLNTSMGWALTTSEHWTLNTHNVEGPKLCHCGLFVLLLFKLQNFKKSLSAVNQKSS